MTTKQNSSLAIKKGWRIALTVFLSGATFIFLLFAIFFTLLITGGFRKLPSKEELTNIKKEEASLILDYDHQILGRIFSENRTNIKWEDVPNHLINCLIATEDQRFFEHSGFDGKSYVRVFIKTFLMRDKSSGGGSTITQQLVKNLYGRHHFGYLSVLINKSWEGAVAHRMEKIYSKNEILLLYLNSVPFGENVYGIEVASQRYFGKKTKDLKLEEAAVLIGILKANTYYNPRLNPENATQRRNRILSQLANQNFIDKSIADSLKKMPLQLHYENIEKNSPAGYFSYQVKKEAEKIITEINQVSDHQYNLEKDGLLIQTTLDGEMQKLARESILNHLTTMQQHLDNQLKYSGQKQRWLRKVKNSTNNLPNKKTKRELYTHEGLKVQEVSYIDSLWHYQKMLHAGFIAMEPHSGRVKVWVGGNHFRYLPFDHVLAQRQAASTIKPILYASALENGYSPCTYFENQEKEYPEYNDWFPQNFDHSTSEENVAMWYALANSMNLPTVDLYFKLGYQPFAATCDHLFLPQPPMNTPAVSLGAYEVSLLSMIQAYSSFFNNGKYSGAYFIESIAKPDGSILFKHKHKDAEQVLKPQTATQIRTMLQTAVNEGTGQSLRGRFQISSDLAGKTGTSQNYGDAWFIGASPDLIVGTRVGTINNDVHFTSALGTGSSLALPIAGNFIHQSLNNKRIRKKYLSSHFPMPDYFSKYSCDAFSDKKAGKKPIELIPIQPRKQEDSKVKTFFKRLFGKKRD